MQQIADWLEKLGLGQYAQGFAENEIDISVLRHLSDQDLKDIGVPLGHRRKILAAIGGLTGAPPATREPAAGMEPKAQEFAERRQVTVMFSDLVGSTALSARMDPEDLREIISAYQKCVAATVQRFGGFVAKYMGDGVLVYFGYPQAHEDDAERAVRAGLGVIAEVGSLRAASPLQTRVGIATGLVVVGDLIGSGAAQERGIVGETPNLAARLQGIAEPNTVVIAESTRKLIGNLFELQDLAAKDVKGIAEPVRAWTATRPSSVESRFEALRSATTPLVGREEEVELLLRRWAQATAGEGCVVLISGEPGIGKSRLTETVQDRLGAEPHTRLRFFCSPHHQDSPLYPPIAQLERAAGFRREDTAEVRLTKLEALLAQATNDVSGVAPLFADLLSIPTGDRYPALNLTPQKRKEKTLQALVAQAEGLALRRPALMIFEDIHWSDPTTRELLDLLIERVPKVRLLVLITYRPEFSPAWVGRPHVTLLTLGRLPPRQRSEMIIQMTGGKALPREITNQIVERTDGVPLFIEELTKAVIESGVLTDAGDRYTAADAAPSLAIPASLHASLLARLDRLAPTREVAQIGATLGRSFSHELISAVADMPQPVLDDALDQLVRAELIFRRGTPPNAEYAFKHALVQDAAYSTLLRSRRQQLHGRIAAALESQFTEMVGAQPQLMAHHYAEAGLTDKAISYSLKAGQQMMARSAMLEAVSQLQKGLAWVTSLPIDSRQQQLGLDLQVSTAQALLVTKGYAASAFAEAYGRARSLAEQLNRRDYLPLLLHGLWAFHLVRDELKLSATIAEQMEMLGQEGGNTTASLIAKEEHGIRSGGQTY
jgi:class 3 adenylate cyclase